MCKYKIIMSCTCVGGHLYNLGGHLYNLEF
jgi:hypothetical protein